MRNTTRIASHDPLILEPLCDHYEACNYHGCTRCITCGHRPEEHAATEIGFDTWRSTMSTTSEPRSDREELAASVIRGVERGVWFPTDATKNALVDLMRDYLRMRTDARGAEPPAEVWPMHVEVYVEGQGHRVYWRGRAGDVGFEPSPATGDAQ